MASSIDLGINYEFDRIPYSEVVDCARRVFEQHDFMFTQSTDIKTDNPTLLFNISGGVKYEHVLAGDEPAPSPANIASIQRCIRADGLSKVGYSGRHHIAFDMLGHFNFFDYEEYDAKVAAIIPVYRLLQELNVRDIFARHHPDDHISRHILEHLGVAVLEDSANTHICNNRRRSGNRVEFGRLINGIHTELWNIVFTLYEGIDDLRIPLTKVAFDSGASMDRLVAAANDKTSDYMAGHWQGVISEVDDLIPYDAACRTVDFARAAAVLIQSGVAPGAKKQAYIARKVFNELVRLEEANPTLDIKNILQKTTVAHEIDVNTDVLLTVYESEKERVERSKLLGRKAVRSLLKSSGNNLSDTDYEYLKSTHGLKKSDVDSYIKDQLSTF